MHNVIHITLLKPYVETEAHGPNYPNPPPELIEGEFEYEVERIIRHRKRGSHYEYLIRWKGYNQNDDSWETEDNLKNAPQILDQYKSLRRL